MTTTENTLAAEQAALTTLNAACAAYDAYSEASKAVSASSLPFSQKVWPTWTGPIPVLALAARRQLVDPCYTEQATCSDRRLRRIERKYRFAGRSVARAGAYRSLVA